MANKMTTKTLDAVQCPVCFNDFEAAAINGHLDVCLLKSVTDSSTSTTHDSEPPPKKSRISAETEALAAAVNTRVGSSSSSSMAGTSSPALFSLFQTGSKGKVSLLSEGSGLFSSKQTVTAAVNKGVKRSLPGEAEPGPAGTESEASVSDKHANVSPRTLLTMDKPLAEIMRPNTLEEYFGQNKVIGQQTLFRPLLDSQEIPSLILWGPPGCGKVGR